MQLTAYRRKTVYICGKCISLGSRFIDIACFNGCQSVQAKTYFSPQQLGHRVSWLVWLAVGLATGETRLTCHHCKLLSWNRRGDIDVIALYQLQTNTSQLNISWFGDSEAVYFWWYSSTYKSCQMPVAIHMIIFSRFIITLLSHHLARCSPPAARIHHPQGRTGGWRRSATRPSPNRRPGRAGSAGQDIVR